MQYFQRLKDMREDNNKNQEEIAEILKTTRQQYSRWESGNFQMPIENYKILARYYNVSIDYLSGLTNTPKTLDGTNFKITTHIKGNNNTTITGNGNKIHIKN